VKENNARFVENVLLPIEQKNYLSYNVNTLKTIYLKLLEKTGNVLKCSSTYSHIFRTIYSGLEELRLQVNDVFKKIFSVVLKIFDLTI
jgi:hypothetical protein